jgi:outer membrane biosynthesis protein TonB
VLDDLRVVEERIATRLAELEPLVQEYNELQEIAARLNIDRAQVEAAAAAAPAPAAEAAPKPAAELVPKSKPKAKPKPKPKAKAAAKPKPAAAPKAAATTKPAAAPKAAAAKRKPAAKRRAVKGAAVRRQPGGTQKAGAERRERMLALIGERPGITVPELSEALATDAPSLYRVVRKLQSDGTIAKDGKSLRLTAPSGG